jgi:hypothetical protein
MSSRAQALADRVEAGAREIMTFVENCTHENWQTIVPNEGRSVGVFVHHVASMYPAELDLIKLLTSRQAIKDLTTEMVDQINADHADEQANVTKEEALELLQRNSAAAVKEICELSDEQLDRAAPISLHWDAPLTAQYFIEQHPLSHPYAHLDSIQTALGQ